MRQRISIVSILNKKGFGKNSEAFFRPLANPNEPFANRPQPAAETDSIFATEAPHREPPIHSPGPSDRHSLPRLLHPDPRRPESLLDPGRDFVCPCCGCRLVLIREASAEALGELEKVAEAQRQVRIKVVSTFNPLFVEFR